MKKKYNLKIEIFCDFDSQKFVTKFKGGREDRAGTAEFIVNGMRDVSGTNVEWDVVPQCGSSEFPLHFHKKYPLTG